MCAVPSGVNVGLEVRSETTRERVEAKAEDEYVRGGLRWKLETVRPYLEAEPAASGPRAVTQRRSNCAVPRTFSSGESGKTSARVCKRNRVMFFHTYRADI